MQNNAWLVFEGSGVLGLENQLVVQGNKTKTKQLLLVFAYNFMFYIVSTSFSNCSMLLRHALHWIRHQMNTVLV